MRSCWRQLAALTVVAATLVAGCSGGDDTAATGWTDQEVTFDSAGLTIYGTYRHRDADDAAGPAALLISESGETDRNGDNNIAGPVGNMRQLAELLSERDVSSLRYDKVATGETGIGPYRPADVDNAVYIGGAQSAARFLADQPASDQGRISVYGVGEGAVRALELGVAGDPGIHSLALLQPLPGRYLDLITTKLEGSLSAEVDAGAQAQADADALLAEWQAAVKQVRESGTVPDGLSPSLAAMVNPQNVAVVSEADAIDPVALASTLPAGMPVLLTCSDIDFQAHCDDMQPLIDALAHTDLQVVRFTKVNHVLKDDEADNVANYANGDPLSQQLVTALDTFAVK
ncbi:MAG: hypothetical protein ACSLE6_06915 [Mycobacterium sp.]